MSKQVRLRRGTTAQHATFTGADGEVTFDTTKKALVVHDGATPGGLPLEGWLKLSPGGATILQELTACLKISGGDEDNNALLVTNTAVIQGKLTASGGLEAYHFIQQQETLTYAATVNLAFGTYGTKRLDLTGNVTFTTSQLGYGRQLLVKIAADASSRSLAFPAGWKFVGGAAPASIAANKTGLLELWAFGTADTGVVARWSVEP